MIGSRHRLSIEQADACLLCGLAKGLMRPRVSGLELDDLLGNKVQAW